ncbi:MAG: pre-peptidase C-terminal domain-containing protein, partial [Cyanobacteriota bacterium]|nr:pre-peptidase C-terminal domain-containing protein [Cyanobacteriota bacterium]
TIEVESNDTLDIAIAVNLSEDFPEITIAGDINYDFFTNPVLIDASEDVDFYAFDLDASETLLIDVDASGFGGTGIGSPLDSILRLFDAEGNELEIVGNAPAPNEVFLAFGDPYLEFTAPEAGTYYAGISNLGNDDYDPFVVGSGSGWVFPDFGFDVGPYEVTFTLEDNQVEIIGTDDNETLNGNDGDNLVAGLLGDDTLFGNSGDDVLRGDRNSRSPGGSVGGDDVISGGDGNDQIGGKAGNDLLSGDTGDDEIFGDDGDDTIMGGTGNDTLTGDDFSGGSGSDLFVFGNGDGTDIITDFDVSEDLIGLVEGELTFEDIEILEIDGNAAINIIETEETLAVLDGVEPDELTEDLFLITPDISFG